MQPEHIVYRILASPIGDIIAGATSEGCCVFEFLDRGGIERISARLAKRYRMTMKEGSHRFLDEMEVQGKEYFAGARRDFSVRLDIKGTQFEQLVWEQLLKIPYGETRSYGGLATTIGKPGAARAVGRANGANYLAIIVPCHRVIEADGNLRGYGGGLWRKKFLLDLEGKEARQRELFVITNKSRV